MGCRNRGFSAEEGNDAVSASLSDALLFTTMCIIGLPVDVHVIDGSIYSGIFYTACVEDDYAIVLKTARMIKKGTRDVNIANGILIETLIIQSEDLVQVIAKGVPFPANGSSGNFDGDDVGTTVGNIQFPDGNAEVKKRNMSNMNRSSNHVRNGFPHDLTTLITSNKCGLGDEDGNSKCRDFAKDKEDSSVSTNERRDGDAKRNDCKEKFDSQADQTADLLQVSSSSGNAGEYQSIAVENVLAETNFNVVPNDISSNNLGAVTIIPDHQTHEKHSIEDTRCSGAVPSRACADAMPTRDSTLQSSVSSSLASTKTVPSKSLCHNKPAKESKLNPGAKIFSPLAVHQRSGMSPVIQTVPSVTYIPDPSPVVPVAISQPEFDISPFSRASTPIKFVPHSSLLVGNGNRGIDPQYAYPVIGHTGNRIQPVRYAGQYHNLQAVPAFIHPNSQNVMVGRMGQVVYLQPVAHDIHSATGFSQVSARPILAPHQVHYPKHQGSATAQALQLCMTPLAGGQQPFVMPSHLPLSPSSFPVLQPITVPGPNGFLSTKLA